MPSDHVATVRALYEAFGRGDVTAIVDAAAEDIQWEASGVDHGVPWLVPGRGRAHVRRFFEAMAGVELKRFEPTRVFGDGDHVLAVIAIELVVLATGRPVAEEAEAHLWTFGPDGEVTAFRHYVDTVQHLQAWTG